MCYRRFAHLEHEICKIKEELKFLEGRDSLSGALRQLSAENAELKTDLKICKKPDGQVFLQPNHLAAPYTAQPHAIAAHAPVVDVKRVRGDFDDPVGINGCGNGATS